MSKKRGNREFIADMIVSCQRILDYTRNMTYTDFYDNLPIQDAVIRNLEILGEATKNLTMELRDKYEQIDWSGIARMRDKFIHYYFGLDISVIWDFVQFDIPSLKNQLQELIKSEGWQQDLEEIL